MRPIITSKVKGGLNLRTQSLIQSFYFSLTIAHKHFTGSVVMRENWRGKSNKKRKISIPIEDDDSGVVCVWSRLTHTGRVGLAQSSWGGSAGWPVVVVIAAASVVSSVAAGVGSSSGGLRAWCTPSVSGSSSCPEPVASSSSSSSSSGAPSSPGSWRRLSWLLRSFLSFCRALHSRSSSSSFPCRALKWPSRRVFYDTAQRASEVQFNLRLFCQRF